jgi:D-glycero-D-manno-heptose 1,7-bisphosphate phosphatase
MQTPTIGWPTVYFDADGVIVPEIDRGPEYERKFGARWTSAHTLDEFRIVEGLGDIISAIHAKNHRAIIITNKPALANGEMLPETYAAMRRALMGSGFDDIYTCPHTLDSGCECRKPKPGMLLQAARKWNSPLERSIFVGDRGTDLMAAKAAGCVGVLLDAPRNKDVQALHRITTLEQVLSFL